MGIYDRDYYRKEGPSYLDSFAVRGQVCKWLLIVTIGIYVLQLLTRVAVSPFGVVIGWSPGPITEFLILDTDKVLHGEVWRLLSYAFLHDDGTGIRGGSNFWTHIFFNMWLLWVFGSELEEHLGRWEFLAFYLVSAVVGGLAYLGEHAVGLRSGYCLGASGAITALLILTTFRNPRLTILLFFVLPTPIWVLAIFQVAQDSLGFLTGGDLLGGQGRTAFSVHLGGAAFATLYYQMEWRILNVWDGFRSLFGSWKQRQSRPRLRVFRGEEDQAREPVAVASAGGAEIDEQLEAKLDAVLEKVSRTGKESLTEQENQILMRASEIYKKRRT